VFRYKVAESAVKPGSVVDNHSSRPCVTARLKQHTRVRVEPTHSTPIWPCSEWGLPCRAALSPHAVGSYPTVSPLPRASCDAVRRSVLCCTGRRLAPPRRYLALCSVEPGLSSAQASCDAVVLTDSAVTDCRTAWRSPDFLRRIFGFETCGAINSFRAVQSFARRSRQFRRQFRRLRRRHVFGQLRI